MNDNHPENISEDMCCPVCGQKLNIFEDIAGSVLSNEMTLKEGLQTIFEYGVSQGVIFEKSGIMEDMILEDSLSDLEFDDD